MKEQQNSIEEMKNEIIALKKEITNLRGNNIKPDSKYFSITPNPFTQETKINYDLKNIPSKVLCLVYDLQGKIIKKINVPANSNKGSLTLTKDNLPAGVYFISFSTNDHEIQMERVILAD